MKAIINENTHMNRGIMDFGWGNGYVIIPKKHPLHGVHYDSIDVDVHGGLTFSEEINEGLAKAFDLSKDHIGSWIVGFDTFHLGDTLQKWTKEAVEKETFKLLRNLKNISK